MSNDRRESQIGVETKLRCSTHNTFIVALQCIRNHHERNDPVSCGQLQVPIFSCIYASPEVELAHKSFLSRMVNNFAAILG